MKDLMDIELIVRRYLTRDIALYSLWMPGDISTSAIQFTDSELLVTFSYIIEKDDIADVCTTYLVNAGAPVFTDAKLRRAYTTELENQLRHGLSPEAAREAALREVLPQQVSETSATV